MPSLPACSSMNNVPGCICSVIQTSSRFSSAVMFVSLRFLFCTTSGAENIRFWRHVNVDFS